MEMAKAPSGSKSIRKPRADSIQEQVKAFIAANSEITPPDDLKMTNEDMIIFIEVIDEFAKVDWSNHTIRLAALLARTLRDMGTEQEALREEGTVLENARGTPVMNPRRTACQGFASQILSMRRSLGVHAMSGSDKGNVGKSRRINKDSENNSPLRDDDEGLIPTHLPIWHA